MIITTGLDIKLRPMAVVVLSLIGLSFHVFYLPRQYLAKMALK
jgi:hypothetical protein